MITLENEFIIIQIAELGAELKSLVDLKSGREHMWQADPTHWKRTAPILFPIVGNLKNNRYVYNDKEYSLSQHGFARDKKFKAIHVDSSEVVLELNEDEETYKNYPFKFKLRVSYKISGHRCNVKYEVENIDDKEMYFSIGGHPAFKCPLIENTKFEDYYLEFENTQDIETYIFSEDAQTVTDKKKMVLKSSKVLPLEYSLFKEDALILDSYSIERIELKTKKEHILTFEMKNFPYLGIWTTDTNAPFICLEPWFGIKDFENSNGELKNKLGIQSLKANEIFNCEYAISLS